MWSQLIGILSTSVLKACPEAISGSTLPRSTPLSVNTLTREAGYVAQILFPRWELVHDTHLLRFEDIEALSHVVFVEVRGLGAAEVRSNPIQATRGPRETLMDEETRTWLNRLPQRGVHEDRAVTNLWRKTWGSSFTEQGRGASAFHPALMRGFCFGQLSIEFAFAFAPRVKSHERIAEFTSSFRTSKYLSVVFDSERCLKRLRLVGGDARRCV